MNMRRRLTAPHKMRLTQRVRGKYSNVCVITLITALVLLKSLKTYDKFALILDRYINT